MGTQVVLGALQPRHAVDRVVARFGADIAKRSEHFQKYNVGAASYDRAYVEQIGAEYLDYLLGEVRRAARRGVQVLLLPEMAFEPGVLAAAHSSIGPNPHARADCSISMRGRRRISCRGWVRSAGRPDSSSR